MKSTIANMIFVEQPSEAVVAYAKNLVLPNPDYEKKQRMGFWLGRTPKDIRLYEWHGDTLVFPFGLCRDLMPLLRQGEVSVGFRDAPEVDYGASVSLFDYQQEAMSALISAKFGILKSPAGSGKTETAVALIFALRRRALWLCHTADLLAQSRDRALRYISPSLVGTITEGRVNIGAGVTFATVQTMCNVDLERYRHEWDVVVVDEVHRVSQSASTVSRYQKVLNNLAARHKYGLTATPERSDGLIRATFSLVGPIVHEVPEEAVAGRIMPVTVRPVDTSTPLTDACLNPDGTIDYTSLIAHLTSDPARNALIASCVVRERDHSCLILSDRLAHLEAIRALLPPELQAASALISGKMVSKKAKQERQDAIERMRSGSLRFLFATYSLSKEGLDIPRLDRLFLASPVKFSSVVIQSVGRVARVFEGKQTPVAYDFVDREVPFCVRAYRERCRHYRKLHSPIEPGFLP